MEADREALRDQYLAALDHEIADGRSRLRAAQAIGADASNRGQALVAISDVTLDWLQAERDRVGAGGPFDVESARRLLAVPDSPATGG